MQDKKDLKIAFCGGGSGGHVYPLLAVADEVKKILSNQTIDFSLIYFGQPGIYYKDFESLGVRIISVISFKLRRYFSLMNLIDLIKLPFAFFVAVWKMFWVMPDALFSKGGSGSLPVVFAAWFFRIPVFIHESDSIPGLSNVIASKMAKRIGVAFKKSLDSFDGSLAVVGNPIRSFLLKKDETLDQEKAKKMFGFDPSIPLILVLGGSQGAVRVNDFILESSKELVSKYQILHQVGINNFEEFKKEIAVYGKNFIPEQRARYKIIDFFKKEIKEALLACDVVVSRAGSGAIFEIATFGKPSILIPLKEAARNHQFFNAYEYASAGASVVIEEDNLKPAIFLSQLEKIISNANLYQQMSKNALNFAKPNSAQIIAQELIKISL